MDIPNYIKPLFWDTTFSKLSRSANSNYIIKRVLDRGNTNAINWLFKNFPKAKIVDTIMISRDLSQKTANFWSDFYNLDRSKILCLQKHYSPIQFGLSS